MIYSHLMQIIRSYFFVIFQEKFENDDTFIERYVMKHPLLKPELLLVNNQPYGFKKISKKLSSLENFPIYLEIEGYKDEDGQIHIDFADLYTEGLVSTNTKLSDVIYVANLFENYVIMERMIQVNNPEVESVVIFSNLNEIISSELIALDSNDSIMEIPILKKAIQKSLKKFIDFIQIINELLINKKPLNKISLLEKKDHDHD